MKNSEKNNEDVQARFKALFEAIEREQQKRGTL